MKVQVDVCAFCRYLNEISINWRWINGSYVKISITISWYLSCAFCKTVKVLSSSGGILYKNLTYSLILPALSASFPSQLDRQQTIKWLFIYIVVSYFFHYFYAIFDHCVGERCTVGKKCQKIWKKSNYYYIKKWHIYEIIILSVC